EGHYAVRHTPHFYSQWHAACASLRLEIARVLEPMLDPADIPANAHFDPLALLNLAAALERFGDSHIVDGNIDRDLVSATLAAAGKRHYDAIGIGIMGGPQVAPAIAVSKAIREHHPSMPIIWGGYFPTLYTDTTLAAPYVDYAIRGQGEESLVELVSALGRGGGDEALARIGGLSWRRDGEIAPALLPYGKLGDLEKYLGSTFLGRRTAVHQASIGCRFRCTFCGVAAM